MTDAQPVPDAAPEPASPLLLAINLTLTTTVAALYGLSVGQPLWVGAAGGLVGGILILLLLGFVRGMRGVRVPAPPVARVDSLLARLLRPVERAGRAFGRWTGKIGDRIARWVPSRPGGTPTAVAERAALPPVSSGDALALMLANVVLLLLVATVLFGIWVAYVFAIIATPIWLVVLMMMAVDGANPDGGVPLPDDLEAPE